MGDRREYYDTWGALTVEFLAVDFIEPLGQVGTVGIRAVVERLVVAPER